MRPSVIAALAVTFAATTTALAQPSLTPLSDPEEPPRTTAPTERPAQPQLLSEDTATMLSVGTTLGGLAAFAAGVRTNSAALGWIGVAGAFVGPSAGHIYAGEYGHALGMTALRGAGAVTFLYGVIEATVVYDADTTAGPRSYDKRDNAVPLMILGASAFIGGTVYDMIDSHFAARRENRAATVAIAPLATQHTVGLALAGSF